MVRLNEHPAVLRGAHVFKAHLHVLCDGPVPEWLPQAWGDLMDRIERERDTHLSKE